VCLEGLTYQGMQTGNQQVLTYKRIGKEQTAPERTQFRHDLKKGEVFYNEGNMSSAISDLREINLLEALLGNDFSIKDFSRQYTITGNIKGDAEKKDKSGNSMPGDRLRDNKSLLHALAIACYLQFSEL
jgi:hypothetical protein